MAEHSSHKNYSFDDIQCYLNGKMSSTEMHALEKAALQDNFLSDAIEGFNHVDASVASQHINQINASVHKEEKNLSIISFKRKSAWWRIAAIIVLIFGVGVLSDYVFKRLNTQQQIAQVKMIDTNALKQFDSIEPMNKSTNSITETKPAKKNITSLNKKIIPSAKAKKKKENNAIVMNDEPASVSHAKASKNAARNYSFSPIAATKADTSQELFQRKVPGNETLNFKRVQNTSNNSAMPIGGWNNFNNYVAEQLHKDSLHQTNNFNNFVEIEFLVDDEGNPYNLKIITPLNDKSNEKALNIIASGPKWTTTSTQEKVKVKINF